VDVARPGGCSEALHARCPRPAEEKDPLIGSVSGLALREGLVTQAIVDVVHRGSVCQMKPRAGWRSFAAVEPPPGHVEPEEMPVRVPPPDARGGIREIEESLALAIVGAPATGAARAGVALPEEQASRFSLPEER